MTSGLALRQWRHRMKKKKIQYSGKLKSYMRWPVIMVLLLLLMTIMVFLVDKKAGFVIAAFAVVYVILVLAIWFHYKPNILNEMISFATQYGQIQKTILKEFEIPYALLDDEGRVIWMNNRFCEVVGKDSRYNKNIQNLIPQVSVGALLEGETESSTQIQFGDKDYSVKLHKVSIESLEESVSVMDIPENKNYIIALYLFDNTELNH